MRRSPDLSIKLAHSSFKSTYYPLRIMGKGRPYFKSRDKYENSLSKAKPIISVVTIAKDLRSSKRESHFLEMIDSVQSQSYGAEFIEHIIVDAASSDGTHELLNSLIEKGVIDYVVSEPDKGIYNAMNKALDIITGESFIFMNSDDSFTLHGLTDLSNTLYSDSKNCYVYGDAWKVDEKNKRVGSHRGNEHKSWFGSPYCHQALLCKSWPMRQFRFDESFRVTMMEYAFRLYISDYTGVHVPKKTCNFRVGGLSTTDSGLDKLRAEQAAIKSRLASYMNLDETFYLQVENAFRSQENKTACISLLERLKAIRNTDNLDCFISDEYTSRNNLRHRFAEAGIALLPGLTTT